MSSKLLFLEVQYRSSLIRDLKIVFYGKRLTSDTLLAIKTKSLTVKYVTYRIYSKYWKLPIETFCLTTQTWRLIFKNYKTFSVLIYSYINTSGNWKNEKLCGNTTPAGRNVFSYNFEFFQFSRVLI